MKSLVNEIEKMYVLKCLKHTIITIFLNIIVNIMLVYITKCLSCKNSLY